MYQCIQSEVYVKVFRVKHVPMYSELSLCKSIQSETCQCLQSAGVHPPDATVGAGATAG